MTILSDNIGIDDYWLQHAVNVIEDTYGDVVSIDEKNKDLTKFGRSETIGTSYATIMTLNGSETNETYATSNSIDTLSSSSASDDQDIVVEGHTISGTDLTFVIQTATLNGQNKVTLSTPLYRCSRMYNNDTTDLVGSVYAYEDGTITSGEPTDDTTIHCIIPAGLNNTVKAATSTSSKDYWIITKLTGAVLEKASASAEIVLEVREVGKVFRQIVITSASNTSNADESFKPYLIIPPNSDIRLRSLASGANISVSGYLTGVLGLVI